MNRFDNDPVPVLVQEAVGEVRAAQAAVRGAVEKRVAEHRAGGSETKTKKSAATRKRIMDAASGLMRERGSVDFQMNEVPDRCNMSKGALYYYFSDREELVQAVFAEVFDETIEALEATCDQAETGREAIRLLCAEIVRRLDAGGPFTLAISNEMAVSRDKALTVASERLGRIVKLVSTQFTRAKSEGIIREDVDARLAATHVVGGFLLASVAALDLGYDDDREGMVSALVQLSLRGLGTEGAVL